MRKPRTTSLLGPGLLLASLLAASVTAGGCALAREEFGDGRTETAVIAEIVAGGGSGDLTVKRAAGAALTIERRVQYSGERPTARYDSVDGKALRLNSDCGHRCSIDYTVTVPESVKVTVSLGSGNIRVTGVGAVLVSTGSGDIGATDVEAVTAETGSGNVEVADVRGGTVLRTGSGNVTLRGVGGEVTADTESGSIRGEQLAGPQATLRTSSGDVTAVLTAGLNLSAKTSSGDVSVTVPSGTPYQIKAESSSGDQDVRIANDPTARFRLDLRTGSGDIRVVPAEPG